MIALPGIAIQDKIYKSSNSLVYWGIRNDGVAIAIKLPALQASRTSDRVSQLHV
ncbi:hypothetical protein [Nostoc sp. TCL240-02]|uniref:hypothetical protein n=1 Tax=Nostoc sp. TCL240-02 TaxID=2572090 RepID=UPI00157FB8AB|nr:hypothetical protein [Nostoc sp. TCL240-02]